MTLGAIIAVVIGIISILGTVVTVTAVIIQMRSNLGDLKDRSSQREKKEEEIDKQVIELLVSFREFVAAQAQLNVTVKGFMDAQTNINQQLLVEVGHMTKATTEGSQILSLLTEVLKSKKVISND